MRIEMSRDEFNALRKSVQSLNDPNATKVFNQVFSKNHIPEIQLNVTQNSITVQIPDRNSLKFFSVLQIHGTIMGNLLKHKANPMMIGQWIKELKQFGSDITRAFR